MVDFYATAPQHLGSLTQLPQIKDVICGSAGLPSDHAAMCEHRSMVSHDDLVPSLSKALRPTDRDVVLATEALVAHLASGAQDSVGALVSAVHKAMGVPRPANMGGGYTYNAGQLTSTQVDPDNVTLKGGRVTNAARLALAKLAAQGVVVATPEPRMSRASVRIESGGSMSSTTSSVEVPIQEVDLANGYRLTPGIDPVTALPLTSIDDWLTETGPLLSDRIRRTLQEALRAAQRGLFQAAVALLGAVVEGAWYIVGEAFRGNDADLAKYLDSEATAQVQRLVRDQLATIRAQRAAAGELFSYASYLRELRNYGVHAGAEEQESLEHAFTEAATAIIVLQTQRHLVRLLAAARSAGADL